MTRNRALFVCLRVVARLVPVVPAAVLHRIAGVAGTVAYCLLAGQRRAIVANLCTALPCTQRLRVHSFAMQAFRTDAYNWVDTLRIGALSADTILSMVEIHGLDHLQRALTEGRGAILVSMHLGNFDFVGQSLAARGYAVTVPVERIDPPEMFDYLMAQRLSKGVNAVPVERAAREMVRALRDGEMVGIIADRPVAGRSVYVPFFGRPAPFPHSPVALARHGRVPVLLAVGVRDGPGRFSGHISPPLALTFEGRAGTDDAQNLRIIAESMEHFVLRFPGQWLAFSPIWPNATEVNEAATIGQQNEATV